MKNEERIETFEKLGLTFDQARVYIALLQADSAATAKEIAELSKIAKPDIYRIIATLEKESIVEKLVTKPVAFKAISYANVLPTLLQRKRKEQNKLEKTTKDLINDLKKTATPKKTKNTDDDVSIISSQVAIIHRLKKELLETQISLSTVTTKERFSSAIVEFKSEYQKALEKGVKIRLATNRHNPQKRALEIIEDLSNDHNFQVKYFEGSPDAIVSVYDNKVACVTLTSTANLASASAIWSNNPAFMALAQNYFENKWNKSTFRFM